MAKRIELIDPFDDVIPIFKTVDQMSIISGIGRNKIRELVDNNEIEYIRIGNRTLIKDEAIIDWYKRNCNNPAAI